MQRIKSLCDNINGCQTNRHIDEVMFQAERNKCDILGAVNGVIGYMKEEKIEGLRDKLNRIELQQSQAAQNQALISALQPTAQPAYLTCPPGIPVGFNGYSGCGYPYGAGF